MTCAYRWHQCCLLRSGDLGSSPFTTTPERLDFRSSGSGEAYAPFASTTIGCAAPSGQFRMPLQKGTRQLRAVFAQATIPRLTRFHLHRHHMLISHVVPSSFGKTHPLGRMRDEVLQTPSPFLRS